MRGLRETGCVRRALLSGVFSVLLLFVLGFLTAMPTFAQSNGTILGVVKDSTGAVVAGAAVTVTSTEMGQSRTDTTDDAGSFRFSALPVGTYSVKVEKDGFKTVTQSGLALSVAQELVVNSSLEVGSSAQEVTVTGEAPLVNTTGSSLESLVNSDRMTELPLNGRNYTDLTLIQPGIAPGNNSTSGAVGMSGSWFSANGAPVRSNNFQIDGAMMTTPLGGSTSAVNGSSLGVDGIREYKVVTSAYGAQYGTTMGSQMMIVSKGGTNQFHGDAFEYLRNSAMDAANFFDSPADTLPGKRLPEFKRNNFGGSGGGPIRKDKSFVYGVYEGLREGVGVSTLDQVIPAACHNLVPIGNGGTTVGMQTIEGYYSTNPFPNGANLANPAACTGGTALTNTSVVPAQIIPFLGLTPLPNIGTTNQFGIPATAIQQVDYGQMRFDQNITASDAFFARYTIDNSHVDNPTSSTNTTTSGTDIPYFESYGQSRNQFWTVGENHIFSPTVLNQFKFSYSRTNVDLINKFDQNFTNPEFVMVPGEPIGTSTITNLTPVGSNGGYPTQLIQNIYSGGDDLFYTKGRHALQFGVSLNRYNEYDYHPSAEAGAMAFNTVTDFMQGIYKSYNTLTPGWNVTRFWIYNVWGFYVQDAIRVTSRLTVNAGLRYEPMSTPRELNNIGARFTDFYNLSVSPSTGGWTYGKVMDNNSLRNFQPRVGFAWDVFGNGKTAIRSGFGIYDDVGNIGTAILQTARGGPPYVTQIQVGSNVACTGGNPPTSTCNNGKSVIQIPFNLSPAVVQQSTIQSMAYDIQTPYSLQYNLTAEQQLPFGIGLAVSYVGFRGVHLFTFGEINPYIPSTYANTFPVWDPYVCLPTGAGTAFGSAVTGTCGAGYTQSANTGQVSGIASYTRHNPAYASVQMGHTASESNYNSLQVAVNKRLAHGLQFQSSYTFGKSLDDSQGQWAGASECGSTVGSQPQDPIDPVNTRYDWGRSCFDSRNNWHFNLLYHIPDVKSDALAAKFIKGWWVGNIITIQSGYAYSPLTSLNRSNSGVSTNQADRVNLGTSTSALTISGTTASGAAPPALPGALVSACGITTTVTSPTTYTRTYNFVPYNAGTVNTGDPADWLNPCMFTLGPAGTLGNASRNMLTGPPLKDMDISINKDTRLPFLGEAGSLEFRAEIFNVLNHPNFSTPVGTLFTGTATDGAGATEAPIANVTQITTTKGTSRQIQLALRVIF